MFFVLGGVEALLIRLQLLGANGTVLTAGQYNQLFTMHGTTMVFLLGMPLAVGFGNYFVPLMIGAHDVAFPRINMFGYWVVLLGGIFIYSSFFLGGAPERRVVRLHAAHQRQHRQRVPARARPRLLGRRPDPARHRIHDVRDQLHRHRSSTCAVPA